MYLITVNYNLLGSVRLKSFDPTTNTATLLINCPGTQSATLPR